jgi:hypothetical protein
VSGYFTDDTADGLFVPIAGVQSVFPLKSAKLTSVSEESSQRSERAISPGSAGSGRAGGERDREFNLFAIAHDGHADGLSGSFVADRSDQR